MTEATDNEPFVILDRSPRVILESLDDSDYALKGRELSDILGQIETEEASARSSRMEHQGRVKALRAEAEELARKVREGTNEVSVEIEVRAYHGTEEVRVFRADTGGEILAERRKMTGAEKQRHLFPPSCDDPFERGVIAREWWNAEERRPEPGNPFNPEHGAEIVSWVRWRAGFWGDPDPTTPFSSPFSEGRIADANDSCPYADDTLDYDRWIAGKTGGDDPASAYTLGAEERRTRAVVVCIASTADQRKQTLARLLQTPSSEALDEWPDDLRAEFELGFWNRATPEAEPEVDDAGEDEEGEEDGEDDEPAS